MDYERRDTDNRAVAVLAVVGWILALAVGIAFAWFALWGPGSTRGQDELEASPSPTATVLATATATATPPPTEVPTATPTPRPPDSPIPTPAPPTATPTPQPTLVAPEGGVNVRSGPGSDYDRLGTLDGGQTADVMGKYEDWYLIEFEGAPAWVAAWIVEATNAEWIPGVDETGALVATPTAPQPAPAAALTVGESGVNVRSGPGTTYDLIGTLDPGATAAVTGRYEEWYRIDFEGEEGWVAGWLVEVTGGDEVPEVEPSE